MTDPYRLLVLIGKLRYVPAHRIVQVQKAPFCQLHDGQGHKGLCHRCQTKDRIFVHGQLLLRIPVPEVLFILGLSLFIHNGNGNARCVSLYLDLLYKLLKQGLVGRVDSIHV